MLIYIQMKTEVIMQASILDLRYRMKKVLAALARNEKVDVYYRGKKQGTLSPTHDDTKSKTLTQHPAFGLYKNDKQSVDELMRQMRQGRYDDL